ncbi:MAG: DUF1810 family protein [Verrucomicrobiales bacterium]|nr:DUF1810 family protein [Verrucomicrobiales bacterium]
MSPQAGLHGSPEDLKLRSSMTLFSRMDAAPREFREILLKFCEGRADSMPWLC